MQVNVLYSQQAREKRPCHLAQCPRLPIRTCLAVSCIYSAIVLLEQLNQEGRPTVGGEPSWPGFQRFW